MQIISKKTNRDISKSFLTVRVPKLVNTKKEDKTLWVGSDKYKSMIKDQARYVTECYYLQWCKKSSYLQGKFVYPKAHLEAIYAYVNI